LTLILFLLKNNKFVYLVLLLFFVVTDKSLNVMNSYVNSYVSSIVSNAEYNLLNVE